MKTVRFTTFLPFFGGYYEDNAISNDVEYTIENFDCEYPELSEKINDYNLNSELFDAISDSIDNDATTNEINKLIVEYYKNNIFDFSSDCKINSFGTVTYKDMTSPKEYNFSTDKIYCHFDLTEKEIKDIENYCFVINRKLFNNFLKENYSSYSGFISFIDNNVNDFESTYFEKKEDESERANFFEFHVIIEFIIAREHFTFNVEYVFPENIENVSECIVYENDSLVATKTISEIATYLIENRGKPV